MVMPLTLCGVGHGHNWQVRGFCPVTLKYVTKYTQITQDLIYYREKNSWQYGELFHISMDTRRLPAKYQAASIQQELVLLF
jgi:hypothetical protein